MELVSASDLLLQALLDINDVKYDPLHPKA